MMLAIRDLEVVRDLLYRGHIHEYVSQRPTTSTVWRGLWRMGQRNPGGAKTLVLFNASILFTMCSFSVGAVLGMYAPAVFVLEHLQMVSSSDRPHFSREDDSRRACLASP